MKSKYFGLFLILIGFAIPFALRKILPTFLYASVPSAICFWVGFLIALRPFGNYEEFNPYLKWAQYAILVNIVLTVLLVGYFYLMMYLDIRQGIGFHVMLFLSFIATPIQFIFDKIVPPPMVHLPDGSVQVTNTFIRSLFTSFFNLLFYAFSGMLVKYLKDKKITSALTGRRGPCRP